MLLFTRGIRRPRDPAWDRDPKDIGDLIPRHFRATEPADVSSMRVPPAVFGTTEYYDQRLGHDQVPSFNDTVLSQSADNIRGGKDVQYLNTLPTPQAIAATQDLPTSRVQAVLKASTSHNPVWNTDPKNIGDLNSPNIKIESSTAPFTDLPNIAAAPPPSTLFASINKRKYSSDIQNAALAKPTEPYVTLSSHRYQIPPPAPEARSPHSLQPTYGSPPQGSMIPTIGNHLNSLMSPHQTLPHSIPPSTFYAPSTATQPFQPSHNVPQATPAANMSIQPRQPQHNLTLHAPFMTLKEINEARAILDRAQAALEASRARPEPQPQPNQEEPATK